MRKAQGENGWPWARAAIVWLLLLGGPALGQNGGFFQKGVNFTAEWPDVYRSEKAAGMLSELRKYGVNAVAIVPYGFGRKDSPVVRFGGSRIWETDETIERIIREAHARGLKVLLKPQIWVRGGYPGDLRFDSPEERKQWFAQYRLFVEHYASMAARARVDVFCAGVEFSRLTRYEKEWRALIARARQLYKGPIVYAANWGEEFEGIKFWDALDYLGLNQYYPLTDDLAMDPIVRRVEAVSKKYRRPVLFTEAGYSSLVKPHRQPWDETPRPLSPQDQARCYEAVFRAFYRKPWFGGVYWWKVGSNGFGGPEDGSHTPWGKPAMQVIAKWFLNGTR
jgi:hypothetical protein